MRESLLATGIVIAMVGCAVDQPESRVLRSDSVGIAIVESTAPRWEADDGWIVSSEPALDLAMSGDGPEHEFFRVQDATRLRDGTIIVANRGSGEVRAYSSVGRFQWAVGREGEGPGEFQRLTKVIAFKADSLYAFDYWLGRTTVIDVTGVVARIISPYSHAVRIRDLYLLNDSAFVAVINARGAIAGEGLYRMPKHVVRLSTDTGALNDTVAAYAGFEGFILSIGDMSPLFGKDGHVAVREGAVLVGTADSMEYRTYTAGGRLTGIVRVPGYDLMLSDEQVATERRSMIPDGVALPPGYREAVASLPRPPGRPAYDDLQVDAAGNVWLAEHHGRAEVGAPTDWEVFAVDGEWLGAVRLPPRFTVYEIGTDYVLGRWRDDFDVEHVQILKLNR